MSLNLQDIQSYLEKELCLHPIDVLDDSHLHHSHLNYQDQKAYLRILIPKQPLNRLDFQRKVFKLVTDICNQPIHALQILSKG